MRKKETANGLNWKEWFETRPLVMLIGAAVTVSSTTFAVARYFFEQEKRITDQSHIAESQRANSDCAAKVKDLESRLLSIERHVGTETIWDVKRILVSQSQAKALGSDFTYFDDLQCYLAIPKSESWDFKQTDEAEFLGFIYGSKWLKDLLATPLGRMMSGLKISFWRGPDTFEIETTNPQVPVLHVFPYVAIERVNNRKLREATGKLIDEQEFEAKQKAGEQAKRTLDEQSGEKVPVDTATSSPSASETGSPRVEGENTKSARPSEVEAKNAALNFLLDSDIVGILLHSTISDVIGTAAIVKDASYEIVNVEKKGNVFYVHSRVVAPASGTRPKVYLDRENICIGDNDDTVVIQTCAPSTDRRPPGGAWIASWIAGLRVVSR